MDVLVFSLAAFIVLSLTLGLALPPKSGLDCGGQRSLRS
jgi:hypothetical protein